MSTKNCPSCGSNSWRNMDDAHPDPNDVFRVCDDCDRSYRTDRDCVKLEEHTGGSSSYYTVKVENPMSGGHPYTAEAIDIMESLELTSHEANVFKSIWRRAAERQGKTKKGNTALYDAEKMAFFSNRILFLEQLKEK